MSVLVEATTVVIPVEVIDRKLNGTSEFARRAPNRTFRSDGHLAAIGFMNPQDVQVFVLSLEDAGLTYVTNGACVDIAVVDQLHGLEFPCAWLSVDTDPRGIRFAALHGAAPGEIAAYPSWSPESSMIRTQGVDTSIDPETGLEFVVDKQGRRLYSGRRYRAAFPNHTISIRTLLFGDDQRAHAISAIELARHKGKYDKAFRDCVASFRSDRLPFGLPKAAAAKRLDRLSDPAPSLADEAAAESMLRLAKELKDSAPALAAHCCKHAIDLGAVKGYGRLGKLVEAGALGDVAPEVLTQFYRKGAEQGDEVSANRLTRPREGASAEDKRIAFEMAEKGVRDGGSPDMIKRLCEMIDDGSYLPNDPEQQRFWREARPWIAMGMLSTFDSARRGDGYACLALARAYVDRRDLDKAVVWYARAYKAHNWPSDDAAAVELAVIFADKHGRHYDRKRALAFFNAHQGFKTREQEAAYRSVKGWF